MLQETLFNLCHDMEYIGQEAEVRAEIGRLSDSELEQIITRYLSEI